MKKIVVFGATGGTGFQVAKQLLEAGHEVTVILRNPASFSLQQNSLKIIEGDVTKPISFAKALKDTDVVISVLGTGTSTKLTTVYSVGIKNIIAEMQKNDLKRLICVSAGALYTNSQMGLFIRLLTKVILHPILIGIYEDMRLMENEVQKNNLDYTIVRPSRLTYKPFTGKYRTGINMNLKKPFSIGRADLADGIIKLIGNSQAYKSIVEISY